MKKIANILLLMGVLLMALSCIETNGLDEVSEGEIAMSPVLSDMVRTRADDSNTIPYPDGQSFGAFAYYSQAEANDTWTGTLKEYFTNNEFRNEDGQCTGNPSAYWPFSGSLIFAGYSPYDKDADVDFDASNATLSITGFDADGTKNLMYFLPEYTDGEYVRYGKETSSLSVKFSHAMSCLAFNFVKCDGNKTIILKQVVLSSIYTRANFSASASNPSAFPWSGMNEQKDLTIWDKGHDLSTAALEIKAYVIPCDAQDIVITYHIDGEVDDKVKVLSPSEITTWAINAKNTYNITIDSMGELLLTPTVTIDHKNDNDGNLAGSNVVVNLGNLSQADLDRISDLKIVVSNGSDNPRVYEQNGRKLTSSIVDMPYGLTLPYLKQGNYNVNVSYNDGVKDQTVTVTATSLAPKFTVAVSGAKKSGSHTNTGATIEVTSSVSISDNVLKQIPLSDCQVSLSDLTTWYVGSANTTTSQFMVKEAEGKWENNYTLTSEVTFDGETVSASSTTVSLQPSKYKVLDKGTAVVVQKAADLKDGGYYFIRLKESQTRSIWVCNSSTLQLLVNTSYVGDNVFGKEYPNIYVFKFCKLNVSVTDNEYKSVIVGTFRSQYRYTQSKENCYVTWDDDSVIDFDGSINQNYMLYIANRWGSDTDPYMDIYQYKSSNTPTRGSDMLGRVGPNEDIIGGEKADNNIRWGTTFWGANNARKFEIIEVIPE